MAQTGLLMVSIVLRMASVVKEREDVVVRIVEIVIAVATIVVVNVEMTSKKAVAKMTALIRKNVTVKITKNLAQHLAKSKQALLFETRAINNKKSDPPQ